MKIFSKNRVTGKEVVKPCGHFSQENPIFGSKTPRTFFFTFWRLFFGHRPKKNQTPSGAIHSSAAGARQPQEMRTAWMHAIDPRAHSHSVRGVLAANLAALA